MNLPLPIFSKLVLQMLPDVDYVSACDDLYPKIITIICFAWVFILFVCLFF